MQAELFDYQNLQIRAGSVFDLMLESNLMQAGPSNATPTLSINGVQLGTQSQGRYLK